MNKTDVGFYITIVSSLITVFGFMITILQIIKTRKVSDAAYSAAKEAIFAVENTIVISDLSALVKLVQELKNDMRNEKFDAAYLRISYLLHALTQTRQLIQTMERDEKASI